MKAKSIELFTILTIFLNLCCEQYLINMQINKHLTFCWVKGYAKHLTII
jgi:hypothetical protein